MNILKEINLISPNNNSSIKIDSGELVSYMFNNEELIHQKDEPGWNKAEIEMFPIVGPTGEDRTVITPKGECIQDQHGLLREMNYELVESNKSKAVYVKKYTTGQIVKNSKFPQRSDREDSYWPYDFVFKKSIELTDKQVKIKFEIIAEKNMPYMLGFHPAFKLSGKGDEGFEINGKIISLSDIQKVGNLALPQYNCQDITLIKKIGSNINIKLKGFPHVMFWSTVHDMVCIEPITHYPRYENQKYFDKNHNLRTNGNDKYEVIIKPQI